MNGVRLILRNENGNQIAEAVSGPGGPGMLSGYYSFSGLCAGATRWKSTRPPCKAISHPQPARAIPRTTAIRAPPSSNCQRMHPRIRRSTSASSRVRRGDGNFVWNDANRNGIQDAGEPVSTASRFNYATYKAIRSSRSRSQAERLLPIPGVVPGELPTGRELLVAASGFVMTTPTWGICARQ